MLIAWMKINVTIIITDIDGKYVNNNNTSHSNINKTYDSYLERVSEEAEVLDPSKPLWQGTQGNQETTKQLQ